MKYLAMTLILLHQLQIIPPRPFIKRCIKRKISQKIKLSLCVGVHSVTIAAVHSPLDFPEFDGAGWGPRTLLTS